MRRVAIALTFITLLIIGCIFAYFTIHTIISYTCEDIAASQMALESSDFATAATYLSSSYAYWTSHRSMLGALLHHAALDKVDILYQRIFQYTNKKEQTHALTELSELSTVLQQLLDTEAPTLENIL